MSSEKIVTWWRGGGVGGNSLFHDFGICVFFASKSANFDRFRTSMGRGGGWPVGVGRGFN